MWKIWSQFNKGMALLSGGLLGIAMIAISIDVSCRVFFNNPIIGVVDLVTVLIPIFVFLPMANAEIHNSHIRVELATSNFSRFWQEILDIMDSIIGIIFLGLMTWVLWGFALDAFNSGQYLPGITRVPVWPSKFCMSIGAGLFAIQILINGIRSGSNIKTHIL